MTICGGGDRKAQLEKIENVLGRDLSRVLTRIGNKAQLYFHKRVGGRDGGHEVIEEYLKNFDDAQNTLHEEYLKKVEAFLSTHYADAWNDLQDRLVEDHEGIWNWAKDAVTRTGTESQRLIKQNVESAWKNAGPILTKHADALTDLLKQKLGAPENLPTKGTPLQRLGYVGKDHQVTLWDKLEDGSVQRNLEAIFAKRSSGELGKDAERAVKLLPALALEYARVASMMPDWVGIDPHTLKSTDRPDLVNFAVEKLGTGIDLSKTVLRSIATILAVDVASDEDVDTIPGLLNAIGLGSTSAATSTATGGAATATTTGALAIGGVGAAVVGTVAVGYLVYSAMLETRQHDADARARAQQMLWGIKDHHLRHFSIHFKDLMKQVRERLLEALRSRYKLDESLMEKDRLAKALADVHSLRRDLLDELGRSGQTVALFNIEAQT